MLPTIRQMLRRGALLAAVLLAWLILDGPGIPAWLATLGELGLWIGAVLALYWLVRDLRASLRRRRS